MQQYFIQLVPKSLSPVYAHLLFCRGSRLRMSIFPNLPAYKAADIYVPIRHYICRERSTNQLLFMQNKPNVKSAQINVNSYMKSKYEKLDTWLSGKNKANSNPNKPNPRKAKMNVNLTLTKVYRKNDDFLVRINKPNLVKGPK